MALPPQFMKKGAAKGASKMVAAPKSPKMTPIAKMPGSKMPTAGGGTGTMPGFKKGGKVTKGGKRGC